MPKKKQLNKKMTPKKQPPSKWPANLKKLVGDTTQYLQLPTTTIMGTVDESQIQTRNDHEKRQHGTTPFPKYQPKNAKVNDIVWIAYKHERDDNNEDDEDEDCVCYRAKCIYNQSNYWAFHFYDTPDRSEEDKEYVGVFTDNDTDTMYKTEGEKEQAQQPPEKDPSTQKQLIQQMKKDQETFFEQLKQNVQDIKKFVKEKENEPAKPTDNTEVLKALKALKQQHKANPPRQAMNPQGAWSSPLPRNQQGYHPTQNWMAPHQGTQQM